MSSHKSESFIIDLKELTLKDVARVGGKNAALGEMIGGLAERGITVPGGFAVTAHAYRYFIEATGLDALIHGALEGLDTKNIRELSRCGREIREGIVDARFPDELTKEIEKAYKALGKNVSVAVRSSATAEDLPGASFAGQQETFLNVEGADAVVRACKRCFASLFTDRAISYRVDKGFSHKDVALSVGVQRMVRSDVGASGVAFTLDTETGFDKVVVINSAYGLGEYVVQGKVTPDEYIVFKPALASGAVNPILSRTIATKDVKLEYGARGTKEVKVPKSEQQEPALTDEEVIQLARWCVEVEDFFSKKYKRVQPMDIEWGKDGVTGELAILQARPETIHSAETSHVIEEYELPKEGEKLLEGIAVGSKIATGKVRVIKDVRGIGSFQEGEVLVTDVTDPDWEPIMKIASAIITDKGGRTSHAAIVSRELGIPCIVGSGKATTVLKSGDDITVDCASSSVGVVYKGILKFKRHEHNFDTLPKVKTPLMLNIGAPDEAFRHWRLPVEGVGLGRLEFIIASAIQIHPRALLEFERLQEDEETQSIAERIDALAYGYDDKPAYYVDNLAEGVAKIAATFWPHDVIIRFSDFKTNEYRTLLGGELYEPEEENPMIGWRGASRYYHSDFKEAFGLEVKALKKVRDEMGLTNVVPMVPFCRTPEEAERVLEVIAEFGLDRKTDKELRIYMMCEIPSNIIRAEEFLEIFDGYSIGSNDLTQLILGLDRDSARIAGISNENDDAVKRVIADVVKIARKKKKKIGICGQAPSDYPDFAAFLADLKINSISLTPDSVLPTVMKLGKK